MATSNWQDYLTLCKPKVVLLMLVTACVGMCLACPFGEWPNPQLVLKANIGIGLVAASGAAINHWIEWQIDQRMQRTQARPLAAGRLTHRQALTFAISIGVLGIVLLATQVNLLTAGLTGLSMIGYAIIYTRFLKRATPQNIVIGGLAGATPPLLGWTSVTNQIEPAGLLLVLIIFIWTPPHFWALAVHRLRDYQKASLPMLPVTHGVPFTKLMIVLYAGLLFPIAYLMVLIQAAGLLFAGIATVLNGWFLYHCYKLYRGSNDYGWPVFQISIVYLLWLFVALLADHQWPLLI